jgi:hypothetical protein
VANVLTMPALQLGDPMILTIQMETNDWGFQLPPAITGILLTTFSATR